MANNYVITSISSIGDVLTVVGTVNGISVTVTTWVSAVPNGAFASAVAFHNFIAPIMLAALPVTPTSYGTLVGSFSQ
jgi:hypothetical protein